MQWDGIEWACDGKGRKRIGWDGMEWDGMGWNWMELDYCVDHEKYCNMKNYYLDLFSCKIRRRYSRERASETFKSRHPFEGPDGETLNNPFSGTFSGVQLANREERFHLVATQRQAAP